MEQIPLKIIGRVETCYPDKFGTPRQPGLVPAARGFLRFSRELQPELALEGLARFSHLWVVFLFHQLKDYQFKPKVHPPRLNGESMGVFASRSPHRPNPIGLSLVTIESVENDGIWLGGVDLVDGTPVLDVKPYLPGVEARPEARQGWVEQASDDKVDVTWSEESLGKLEAWTLATGRPDLKALIEATIALDPRPLVYKGFEGRTATPYRSTHAVRFYEGDVHFEFTSPREARVLRVLWGSELQQDVKFELKK